MTDNAFEDLGFAKLDTTRADRTGLPETVYCAGKTSEQLAEILAAFSKKGSRVLGTRCSPEQAAFVQSAGVAARYDAASRTIALTGGEQKRLNGRIAVCTGGTADLPVAEEAAVCAAFFGAAVDRHFDVGVAGMEGALASVVAGLVDAPVIAVPTSVGYGASFHGLAALLTMLNSCAEGISVVNIDNGFGAAVQACKILQRIRK